MVMLNSKQAKNGIVKIPMFTDIHNNVRGESEAPRYVYHQMSKAGEKFYKQTRNIPAYSIREHEAADSFGHGFKENKYVWLSQTPFGIDSMKIDLTKLNRNNVRYTGQCEGHMLHKGDIPGKAVVCRMKYNDETKSKR